MWFVVELRQWCLAAMCGALTFLWTVASHAAGNGKEADAIFARVGFLEIQIDIAPDDAAILQSYKRRPPNWERTNVLAVVKEGGFVYSNVFLHLKGSAGSFRSFDSKPALTLSFDKENTEQRFHGLSKISLNNSVQDQSYLCEKIGRELFTAAGVPSPRATHAIVELNGRRLGLFVLVEGWSRQFLKRHFDDSGGNLYERSVGNDLLDLYDVKSGDDPDDRFMLDLAAAATQEDTDHRLEELARVLDLDRFITFMAMEVMLGHWDGYCLNRNNYRIFHDRSTDKLVFLPHGMDQLFGLRRSISDGTIQPQMRGMVASAIMQTPKGRQRYLTRMSELLTNIFQVNILSNRVANLAAALRPAFQTNSFIDFGAEPRRRRGGDFGGLPPPTLMMFDQAVGNLQNRLASRALSVREQLRQLATPVQFGSSQVIDLSGWEWQRDFGAAAFPRRSINGDEFLEINITGTPTRASWRTTVLLGEGRYQFHGLAKMERIPRARVSDEGIICLKTSEGSSSLTITNTPFWIALTNNFAIQTPKYIELICEFSSARGKAQFDLNTLKLRQLSP
jgi:spore coat protein H